MNKLISCGAAATFSIAAALGLVAGKAVSAEIRIGQTTGITGPAAAAVAEINQGAKILIDSVNAEGGINGQLIELVTLDDKNQVPVAVENAKQLMADPRVVALFLTRGTPHAQAIMPLLPDAKMVLLAPSTGAMALHQPVNPWVFNVRSTYQAEAERVTRHLAMAGIEKVALCYVDDSFGADAVQGALKVFKESKVTPGISEAIDKFKPDYTACAKKIVEGKPLGALLIGTSASVAVGVKALREAGSRVTVATLSNNAAAGFVRELGIHASGVIVSQVFPSERRLAAPMIADASRLAAAKNIKLLTPAMIEGFAAAKVLVMGLKRAADNSRAPITRASFRYALESMNRVDIGMGGVELTFSATDHSGLDFVDLSFVAADGSFRR
jgi:ABC-type branched-subunit amino acid transport system substrate-binding protein